MELKIVLIFEKEKISFLIQVRFVIVGIRFPIYLLNTKQSCGSLIAYLDQAPTLLTGIFLACLLAVSAVLAACFLKAKQLYSPSEIVRHMKKFE